MYDKEERNILLNDKTNIVINSELKDVNRMAFRDWTNFKIRDRVKNLT